MNRAFLNNINKCYISYIDVLYILILLSFAKVLMYSYERKYVEILNFHTL